MPKKNMTIPSYDLQKISVLPIHLLTTVTNVIHAYSTYLIKIKRERTGAESMIPIGSGTFVTVGNIAGILTAHHVAKLLDDASSLGLSLYSYAHKYKIDCKYLSINLIARGAVESEGPDLAFIGIPPAELGTIKAAKSFYNLQSDHDRMLASPPRLNLGIWAISGTPDIQARDEKPTSSFSEIKRFKGLCGFGAINKGAF